MQAFVKNNNSWYLSGMRIAFYAPLKSPDHGIPSGDRQMARALIKALQHAGHEVETVSQLRSFSKKPHDETLYGQARREAADIVRRWQGIPPDLWFSYHPYYKAPDFLALEVMKTCSIPVVTAEASLATKRDRDEWQQSQEYVRELLQVSVANFYFTDRDAPGLRTQVPDDKLVYLPPFIDVDDKNYPGKNTNDTIRLITVGMMRKGVKIDSYRLLAQALKHIEAANWQLTIIGDGAHRNEVENLFDGFQTGKIVWAGEVVPDEVAKLLSRADIFVWPGFGEAYGLAYLEAQAAGLPVVAQNTHGVPFAVKEGETSILVAPDDDVAYAQAMLKLIEDKPLRVRLGVNAEKFVRNERNLENASAILDTAIKRVCP
ncbi:Glycosyltransferase [hydrothermal vent metagenome]|uniref:Glycosyltransferase n=1 Tax=hydrothermal vent metagenome TaxID=652676 RepID=A0A3B0RYH3_9ZZZZ